MSKYFDPAKPVETGDGRSARIVCADAPDPARPIVAYYSESPRGDGYWSGPWCYLPNGDHAVGAISPTDLVNSAEKRVGWARLKKTLALADYISTGRIPTKRQLGRPNWWIPPTSATVKPSQQ